MRLNSVDLFSGCGGLSQGLKAAGFQILTAVDNDPSAVATYKLNHSDVNVLSVDIRKVTVKDLAVPKRTRLSLIAGCAPCQGFTSLTSKWRRDDPRNILLLEMARLIVELKPDAVFMENVPGLKSKGKAILDEFTQMLVSAGYIHEMDIVQMADYGVPQNRKRLVFVAGLGFPIKLPSPTHAAKPRKGSGLKRWKTVRKAIYEFAPPITFPKTLKRGGPQAFNWHVTSKLQPQTKKRLRAAIPGETWLNVAEKVRPKCHRNGYRGFTNVYGRMSWDEIAPTMTGGCVTPCKGRFGHPDRRRWTISVREAATLQTFPKRYRFDTNSMEQVTRIIGNAVPPLYARRVGETIRDALTKQYGKMGKR